nr:TetR/AcrR family transcriptional regulator [Streptomyces shenzhenensis]
MYPSAPKPARADARRNRDKLLHAARAAFAAGDDKVSLEAVAREAGVGIGTLYRHFPDRVALAEAVYAAELDALTDSAEAHLSALSPAAALRAFMDRYVQFVQAKRGMAAALRAGSASGRIATRERITAALAVLLEAGARDGSLRTDVCAEDIGVMLFGIVLGGPAVADGDARRTARLLDLLMDALRPRD